MSKELPSPGLGHLGFCGLPRMPKDLGCRCRGRVLTFRSFRVGVCINFQGFWWIDAGFGYLGCSAPRCGVSESCCCEVPRTVRRVRHRVKGVDVRYGPWTKPGGIKAERPLSISVVQIRI